MRVGVVKEIKKDEYRVALTPAGARELVGRGHDVVVDQPGAVPAAVVRRAHPAVEAARSPDVLLGDDVQRQVVAGREDVGGVVGAAVDHDDHRVGSLSQGYAANEAQDLGAVC